MERKVGRVSFTQPQRYGDDPFGQLKIECYIFLEKDKQVESGPILETSLSINTET